MQNLSISILVLNLIIAACENNRLEEVFVNENAEIFTSENLAALSVKGDKEKYKNVRLSEAMALKTKLETKERKAPTGKPSQEEEKAEAKTATEVAPDEPEGEKVVEPTPKAKKPEAK